MSKIVKKIFKFKLSQMLIMILVDI